MTKVTLHRIYLPDSTIGVMELDGKVIAMTVELPWRNNETSVSCIPEGDYFVSKRVTSKFGNHFHVLRVEKRTGILIHTANYARELRGCIGVGATIRDLDMDGTPDITESRKTLDGLYKMLPTEFSLKIMRG